MNYELFGGFEIPLKPGKRAVADRRDRSDFWWDVHEAQEGLCYAFGGYMFAVRSEAGILPWYVGKTAKQGFIDECFAPHKLLHYNDVLSEHPGTPLLYLFARMTPRGRFSKAAPPNEMKQLETDLMTMALRRNSALRNVSYARFRQRFNVKPHSGASPDKLREFKTLLHG